jgi:phthiocerol/phenolphthiocerol synthesis type-I polyketide synthase E
MSAQPDIPAGAAVEPIAIIGLACRVPGARDATEFWRNLTDGTESIRLSTLEEQAAFGVPAHRRSDPNFVPAVAVLDDFEYFDAGFFGMSAREAELRDPQHRLFLELAHTALDDSGYDPARYPGDIGVYAGSGEDAYQWRHTRRNPRVFAASGPVGVAVSSHPDYVATFTSYKLNLTGPSLTLHTACSTSLVALHLACEALRGGECDMALTGGVNIDLPARWGYIYMEDGIYSPDGHCRAFDAQAAGTVWSSGGGVVVLKRLSDAVRDGDYVRAVVLGNAVNNDGAAKVGFTAPSERGQAAVVAQALAVAGVDARTIGYVEAHGTGTSLGDPIEIAALSSAYRRYSADTGWCAIGSVKTNIGHLGPAAGIAGVIKTVLSLEHGLIPPSLHYETPNPKIDFGGNPFYVNAALSTWNPDCVPRRAGVSSFGMGGTNAHVILEEAPAAGRPGQAGYDDRPVYLLRLSARTPAALAAAAERLAAHLSRPAAADGGVPRIPDVAYTLRVGRRELPRRLAVVAADPADAAAALADPARRIAAAAAGKRPRVAFLFSGQGAQYAGMAAQLYQTEPAFREAVDECANLTGERILGEHLTEDALTQTAVTQPVLFVVEYALARLWQSWGVEPAAMAGHSIGEYVAATLAGVFTLPDALHLVTERGRLMQSMPHGAMLAVQLGEAQILSRLPDGLSVAAVNGPAACVVAGPAEFIADFARRLKTEDKVSSRKLRTSHAFHSPMMEPILPAFRAAADSVARHAPGLPFLSNITGDWITPDDATDPSYWARHVRATVRFGDCLATLLSEGDWILVECGPGRQLCGLARLQEGAADKVVAVPTLPGRGEARSDAAVLYTAAARLWTAGIDLSDGTPGRRVPLPAYPWERSYHYIKPDTATGDIDQAEARLAGTDAAPPVHKWFAVPVWRQLPPQPDHQAIGRCLLFADDVSDPLGAALRSAGAEVLTVRPGEAFEWDGTAGYTVRPASRDDYDMLISHVSAAAGTVPDRVVHAWGLSGIPAQDAGQTWQAQDLGFFSLLTLAQAVAAVQPAHPVHIDAITAGTADVTGSDLIRPEHATVSGIALVLPLEMPWLSVRHIDIEPGSSLAPGGTPRRAGVARLPGELLTPPASHAIALRGGRRWQRKFEQVSLAADNADTARGLRQGGVYVITGGLGGIGLTLAEDLARRFAARLVLVARSAMPARADWDSHLRTYGTAHRIGRAIAAIRRMEGAGAEVMVITADIADAAQARRVRDHALARFGRVDGIVHAAGLPGGGMAEVKQRAAASEVLWPKLTGTLALRDAFAGDEPDFVVLCSSVTAVAGGFGQVDYCAANNFLDAHARGPHGWKAPVISVNWGSWREVGMAAEVAAPAAFRAMQRGERISPLTHPLLTGAHPGDEETPGWCRGVISAGTHWVLDGHRIAGVPVLPGTGHLEAARAAMQAVSSPPSDRHVIELRDVVFVEPLAVPDGAAAELRVLFTTGADGLDFEVVSLSGGEARTHARGSAVWAEPPQARLADLAVIRDRCSLGQRAGGHAVVSDSGLLSFGPHWGNVRRVHEGAEEELALLEATVPTAGELGRWVLNPALLDEATAFGRARGEGRYLPLGYGRVTVLGPLPGRLWSHLRHRDTGSTEVVVADVSLFDETGQELVSISDFTLRRVDEQSLRASLSHTSAPITAAAGTPAGAAESATVAGASLGGPGEPLAGQAAQGGIGSADGAEAFRRLVSVDLGPQAVISAAPISEVIASVRKVTQETIEENLDPPAAEPGQERQPAEGYVAPRDALEATIARLWGEVLGNPQVGVTDDFFDKGGNSLVAVQLISMLRKEVGVRLPMRSLFERPTVAGTAALVAELAAEQGSARHGHVGSAATPTAGAPLPGDSGQPSDTPPQAGPVIPRLARPGDHA